MHQPRIVRLASVLAAGCLLAAARGEEAGSAVGEGETADPPTQARLIRFEAAAAASGWGAQVPALKAAALSAYRKGRYLAADGWYGAYQWAMVFSTPKDRSLGSWIDAMVRAGAGGYEGVQGRYTPEPGLVGEAISAGTRNWLFANAAFTREFFSTVKPVDRLTQVLGILDALRSREPERFERYASLALAIAVVYDVPPPPWWPHGQVTAAALSRHLPAPADAFDRLTREDLAGRTYHRLSELPAEDLKFVVDAAAPQPQLDWSEGAVPYGLADFEEAYFMIRYRQDRASRRETLTWAGAPYTLQAILRSGGICVDQAYFASEAGKARGVPTLLFLGAGRDGRHAWFGYLDGSGRWKLDAGRYAEQRLVTGNALDPQTWLIISDHELQFLSERFRALPSFTQSRVHEEFAEEFLAEGDAADAEKAARTAVNYERRNLPAWETLASAESRLGVDPARQEAVLREASLALARYPDLAASYVDRICKSLRARGETSLADFEERGFAQRMQADRSDIAVEQASAILARSIATQPVEGQIATYNEILAQFGRGAGTLFFDRVVVGFAEHLAGLNLRPNAVGAIERAREALEVQPGTQLQMDMDALESRLRG